MTSDIEMRQSCWYEPSGGSAEITRPNPARIFDHFLDGAHNFAVDRQVARRLIELDPRVSKYVQASRYFLRWAVEEMTAAGVEQFVDIGAGVSTADCVREVARSLNPKARTVCVDLDPVAVLFWEQQFLDDPFSTALRGDVRDLPAVLAAPECRALIDLDRPVGVVASAVLQFVADGDVLCRIADDIAAAVVLGSYFAVSHATRPPVADDAAFGAVLALFEQTGLPLTVRDGAEVAALFGGWDLVQPVVGLGRWLEPRTPVSGVAGLGRLS